MKLNKSLLLISLSIASTMLVFGESKTTVTAKESSFNFASKPANNNLPIEEFHSNQQANLKNNKSSSEQLLGAWESTSVSDSGEKMTTTIMYSSDGTYLQIVTRGNKDWYINDTGTWETVGNTLKYNTEARGYYEGSIKSLSNDEFVYKSKEDNSEHKWQRSDINPNLSKDNLIGTWSIIVQDRVASSFIDNPFERGNVKLIELNSDGTFRYKSINGKVIVPGADIVTTKFSGTWTYINSGYADGLLLLKDSQGKLFSFSSIYWNDDGNFVNFNRSSLDRDKNQYSAGRIEEFKRSNLIIDRTF